MTTDTPRDPLAATRFRRATFAEGGGMAADPDGQWVHVHDVLGLDAWDLDPAEPDATRPSGDTPRDPLAALVEAAIYDWSAEGPETMSEFVAARLTAAGATVVTRPSGDEALLLAVEEVDNAWHDEGDHVEYHEELAERLITLRDKYAALATPASSPTPEDRGPDPDRHRKHIASTEAFEKAIVPATSEDEVETWPAIGFRRP